VSTLIIFYPFSSDGKSRLGIAATLWRAAFVSARPAERNHGRDPDVTLHTALDGGGREQAKAARII
jgi:hypothetical protein